MRAFGRRQGIDECELATDVSGSAVGDVAVTDHQGLRRIHIELCEGVLEDRRFGLDCTYLEREDELVDPDVPAAVGERRTDVEGDVAQDGSAYALLRQ